jgi:hypothetical protein
MGVIFPAIDPIPLPAPVWLFKVLLDLTLSLHFAALYLLLGGLLLALVLNLRGHAAQDPGRIDASGVVAGWLPVTMTYVINLGIPPLLFAQVLYGRALFTSSVLIGAYWIAVIPLLIVCYHLLYVTKARAAEGRPFAGPAVGSLLTAGLIARIYTANMTLMIDPAVWAGAYHTDQTGSVFLTGPASWARWVYMIAAGVAGGGVLAAVLSRGKAVSEAASAAMRGAAVRASVGGSILAVASGVAAWGGQPAAVQEACNSGDPVWAAAVAVWAAGLVGVVCFAGVLMQSGGRVGWKPAAAGALAAFLQTAGFVVCRDLIRDAALSVSGFDVWARAVAVNWSVLELFFVLFVSGLGVVGWLASVAYRATPAKGEVS